MIEVDEGVQLNGRKTWNGDLGASGEEVLGQSSQCTCATCLTSSSRCTSTLLTM